MISEESKDELQSQIMSLRPKKGKCGSLSSEDILMIEAVIFSGCGICQASKLIGKSTSYLSQVLTYEGTEHRDLKKWLFMLKNFSLRYGLSNRDKIKTYAENKDAWKRWHRFLARRPNMAWSGFQSISASAIDEEGKSKAKIDSLKVEVSALKSRVKINQERHERIEQEMLAELKDTKHELEVYDRVICGLLSHCEGLKKAINTLIDHKI